jgi:deoxyribonuclease V
MIACFDVHYSDNEAKAAAVVLAQWSDTTLVDQFTLPVTNVGEYRAGSFYQRELQPLRELLAIIPYPIQYFVIDAYCHLANDGSPGLGTYFYDVLPDNSIVVGVAKSRFRNTTHAIELLRGTSHRPLFITSIGIDYPCAAAHVQSMAGEHRLPTVLKTVDRLSRS